MSLTRGIFAMLSALFFAVLAVVLFAIVLLATEVGLYGAIEIAKIFLPGELEIGRVQGRLLGPVTLENVYYESESKGAKQEQATVLSIARIQFDWQPSRLWDREVFLKTLNVQGLVLEEEGLKEPVKQTEDQTEDQTKDQSVKKENKFITITDANLQGEIKEIFSELTYEFALDWKDFELPFLEVPTPLKEQGSLRISGDLENVKAVLEGSIANMPLQGDLNVTFKQSNIFIREGNIRFGDATFNVKGVLGDDWNIKWSLEVPELHKMLADVAGQIQSQGSIVGPKDDVHVKGNLNLHEFDSAGLYVNQLSAVVDVDTNVQDPSTVSITAKEINKDALKIKQWQFDLKGTALQHVITSILDGNGYSVALNLPATWTGTEWKGDLKQFDIKIDDFHTWRLKQPTQMIMTKQSLLISPLCLQAQKHSLCVQLELPAVANQPIFHAKQPIRGSLKLDMADLSDFSLPTSRLVRNIQGKLTLDLMVTGVLSDPMLSGKGELRDGRADFPRAGVVADSVTLTLDSPKGERIAINGQASTGKGILKLVGDFSADLAKPQGEIRLEGQNVLVADTSEFYVLVSPQLKAIVADKRIDLTGTIDIPKAKIQPEDFTSADELSRDVVIAVDEQGLPIETKDDSLLPIYTEITVRMGKHIYFAYSGIRGNVLGELTVMDDPERLTTATGQINLEKGEFMAHGQFLKIDRGKLLYAGGPINNPRLDIRASRTIRGAGPAEEVRVGVDVTGSIHQPRVVLFSEPSNLSQGDILSYLVLGRSMQQSTGDDQQTLASSAAALNLGFFGASQVSQDLEHSLGLDVVSVGTMPTESSDGTAATQETALVLGKYLSPRLYVGYAVGLVDQISVFNMRYQFAKRWFVQTESSVIGNAVDVFYTFEHD